MRTGSWIAGLLLVAVSAWGQAQRVKSGVVDEARRVTFRVVAPKAGEVFVQGNWPGGQRLALQRAESGEWTATAGPLEPETWYYTLSVDGVGLLDAGNEAVVRDGLRQMNVLDVPSTVAQAAKVPHGSVAAVWYPSSAQQSGRRMLVYTPPGYETAKERYPVLYLFHGGGGDEQAWTELGRTPQIFDNLIAAGKAKPMIVVMPNANWKDLSVAGLSGAKTVAGPVVPGAGLPAGGSNDYVLGEQEIVKDIVPFVEARYRTLKGRENRAIAGLSMGGGISIAIGLKRLDVFATVAQFSTGMFGGVRGYGDFDIEKIAPGFLANPEATNKKLRLLYFSCGTEDPRMPFQQKLAEEWQAKKIALTFQSFAGNHEWRVWRNSLADLAGKLFR